MQVNYVLHFSILNRGYFLNYGTLEGNYLFVDLLRCSELLSSTY